MILSFAWCYEDSGAPGVDGLVWLLLQVVYICRLVLELVLAMFIYFLLLPQMLIKMVKIGRMQVLC